MKLHGGRTVWQGALLACLLLTGLWISAPAAAAQVLYGSIVGNVKDNTGGVLPGATVTITHNDTKATREAVTDETGAYRFPTVQTGPYTVVATMSGFQRFTRTDVVVTLNTVARVDITMPVGQVQENVTVSARSEALQTDRAEIRSELQSRELDRKSTRLNSSHSSPSRMPSSA